MIAGDKVYGKVPVNFTFFDASGNPVTLASTLTYQMYNVEEVDGSGNPSKLSPIVGSGGGGGGGGDASAANQSTQITAANLTNTRVGAVDETAPESDTASSGLNGRLQRIAQNLTSFTKAVTSATSTVTGWLNVISGMVYNATPPVLTDGQFYSLNSDTRANLKVTLMANGTTSAVTTVATNTDTQTTNATGSRLETVSRNTVYNGSTFDRSRSIEGASTDTGVTAFAEYMSSSANATATLANSTALEAQRVVKASAGNIFEISGYTTSAGFVQIFNSTTVPADTAVPIISFAVSANSNFSRKFEKPVRFGTGISVCHSSTQATKTVSGNVAWFEVLYK